MESDVEETQAALVAQKVCAQSAGHAPRHQINSDGNLYRLAGRLTSQNGGFRPGQWRSPTSRSPRRPQRHAGRRQPDELGNRVGEKRAFDEWSRRAASRSSTIPAPTRAKTATAARRCSAGTNATGTVALMDDCHVYTDVADCGGGFCSDKSPVSVFNDATWPR